MMIKHVGTLFLAVAAIAVTAPARAGEVTGNGKDLPVNGHSLCAYSGLNDTPDGIVIEISPGVFVTIDPGGHNQSYGYFFSHSTDFLDSPSDPAARSGFAFPANGCNPTWQAP